MRASSPARADSRITGTSRSAGLAAQPLQQPEAIDVRHHDVGQDEVGTLGTRGRQRLGAVVHRLDRVHRREQVAHVSEHVGIVVGEHDARAEGCREALVAGAAVRRAWHRAAGASRCRHRRRAASAPPPRRSWARSTGRCRTAACRPARPAGAHARTAVRTRSVRAAPGRALRPRCCRRAGAPARAPAPGRCRCLPGCARPSPRRDGSARTGAASRPRRCRRRYRPPRAPRWPPRAAAAPRSVP